MKILGYVAILVFQLLFCCEAQDRDTILVARKTKYLTDFFNRPGYIQSVLGEANRIVEVKDKYHIGKPQNIIKSDSNLFLTFSGSGRIYSLKSVTDTSYTFIRLDSTENINYNLSANYFIYKGILHSFGGYGFWRTTGNLRYFNIGDHQWDIVPLSEEIIPQFHPTEASWFDPNTRKFYVPVQSIVNAGIKGKEHIQGKVVQTAHVLDLITKDWTKLGKTNKQVTDIIKNAQISFKCDRGLIFLYFDKVYLLDFAKNKVYIIDKPDFAQRLGRKGFDKFLYEYQGFFYTLNSISNTSDSLKIDYEGMKEAGFPIWGKDVNYVFVFGTMILVITIVAFYFHKKKKIKNKPTQESIQPNYKIRFTDTEITLLNLLIEKGKLNTRANINEVNYVLGLKHKNTGLQKKVRSDTFNSVNEKFKYISKREEPVIQSIRSEDDKRYFEYFVEKINIELIYSQIQD